MHKIFFRKKRAELTIQTLIMLAAGAILLIMMIFILTGKVNFFNKNTGCSSQGGTCTTVAQCTGQKLLGAKCEKTSDDKIQICCMPEGITKNDIP